MICQDMTINAINSYYLVLCQSDKNPVGNCQYTCLALIGKEGSQNVPIPHHVLKGLLPIGKINLF